MTIDSDDVTIEMDLTVERGVGYLAAERSEALPIRDRTDVVPRRRVDVDRIRGLGPTAILSM